MQSWLPDLSGGSGPIYLAIADAMLRDVDTGALRPGHRLPPQRTLAKALGVDLTTITRAYGEAQRIGLIESDGRRGSFIADQAGQGEIPRRRTLGDAGMNAPPELFGGLLSAEFRRAAERLLSGRDPLALQYQPRGGMPQTRRAGARLLAERGLSCSEDSVLVTAGGQHALHAVFSAELRAGDSLAVASAVYPGLLALARRLGVILHPVASDDEGLDPRALAALCEAKPIRGFYAVPTNDNPTTATMGLARRQALAAAADRYDLLIIEDDAYGILPADPLPPIATFAPDRTWHIASVSKILSPGLRVAWLSAPGLAEAWRLAADLHETAVMAPPLNSAIVAEWLDSGLFGTLIAAVRAEAAARQALLRAAMPGGTFRAHPEGYHLWVPATPASAVGQIGDALRPHGLTVTGGEAFAADRDGAITGMRISFGGATPRDMLDRAFRMLAALVDSGVHRDVALV